MKRKGLLLVLLLALAMALTACGNNNAEAIVLPSIDDIDSVTIQDDVMITNLIDEEWTKTVLAVIAKAEPTSKESVQDVPDAENCVQIDFNLADGSMNTMFCYEKDGSYYIEQPYQGIYQTDKAFYDMLKNSL